MSTDATNSRDSQFAPLRLDPTSASGPVTCVKCGTVLRGSYHTINEQMACAKCRFAAEESAKNGGSAFGKAAVYGIGAAIGGAIAYYAFTRLVNFPFKFGAILVGLGVAQAVHVGSGKSGGRRFQIMAVLLTWCAIGGSFAPFLLQGVTEGAQTVIVEDAQARIDSIAAANEGAEPDSATEALIAVNQRAISKAKNMHVPASAMLIGFVTFMFTAPVLAGFVNPFLWLGVGVAVYRSWKANEGDGSGPATVSVAGPFRLHPPASAPPAA